MVGWERILWAIAAGVFMSGVFSVLANISLLEHYGKRTYDLDLGRGVTMRHYSVDEKARQRIRRGTLIFFLLVAVLIFACAWTVIGAMPGTRDMYAVPPSSTPEVTPMPADTPALTPGPLLTPTATAPATPSPTVTKPRPSPTLMPPSEVMTYTVQAGDTLSEIAAEFGVTVDAIVEANDIEDLSLIQVGQVLAIPSPELKE